MEEDKKENESDKNTKKGNELSWRNVEKFLAEGTVSGNTLAIIETEKIFTKVLEKLNFPGKTFDEKIVGLKPIFSNFNELCRVRKIYKNLIASTTNDYSLENLDIKKILTIYYRAIEDMTKYHQENRNILKKIKVYSYYYFSLTKKNLKKIGIFLLVFFFIIFVFDSTKIGRNTVTFLVSISHFIFSWVLFTVLLVGGIIIIVMGSIFYFESRKKKKSELRVEE